MQYLVTRNKEMSHDKEGQSVDTDNKTEVNSGTNTHIAHTNRRATLKKIGRYSAYAVPALIALSAQATV
jgi:hypothetical protein